MKKIFCCILFLLASVNAYSQGWVFQSSGITSALRQVAFYNDNTGWAAGDGGKVLRSTNGGTTWDTMSTGTTADLYSITYLNADTLLACGTNGVIIRSSNKGTSWAQVVSGTNVTLRNIGVIRPFSSFHQIYIVGDNGKIIYSNNGISWINDFTNSTEQLNGIMFISIVTGYVAGIAGNNGKLLTGIQWRQEANFPSTSEDLLSIAGYRSANNYLMHAVSNAGNIFTKRFPPDTASWRKINTGVNTPLRSVAGLSYISPGIPANGVWAVGDNGAIRHSADTGKTWVSQNIQSTARLNSIYMLNATKGWIVGEGGLIAYTSNGGLGIKQLSTEMPEGFRLQQNYPNPFNPSTKIKFSIPAALGSAGDRSILLSVYNSLGKEVGVLVNEALQPGTYEFEFNAEGLTSGTYFYMLKGSSFTETKKMLLIK